MGTDEFLKVELKNANIQSFNTRWEENITAMTKQLDEEVLEICLLPSAFNIRRARVIAVAVHLKILFKRVNRETAPALKTDGGPIPGADES